MFGDKKQNGAGQGGPLLMVLGKSARPLSLVKSGLRFLRYFDPLQISVGRGFCNCYRNSRLTRKTVYCTEVAGG